MTDRKDILVVGGGPAGSASAIHLAREGHRVRLIDKNHFPRPKLCGGFIGSEGIQELRDLGVLDSLLESGATPIHRLLYTTARGTTASYRFHEPALSVSRQTLDAMLIQKARAAGVTVLEGTYAADSFGSDIRVVASGRLAQFDRQAKGPVRIGVQAYYSGIPDVTDQVELHWAQHSYVGLARQGTLVNLCALVSLTDMKRCAHDLDRLMAILADENQSLRHHLRHAERRAAWLTTGPVQMGVKSLVDGDTFYVGDAACVIDPFLGEGMATALYAARLLGVALRHSLPTAQALYPQLWRQAFAASFKRAALMRYVSEFKPAAEMAAALFSQSPRLLESVTQSTRFTRLAAAL